MNKVKLRAPEPSDLDYLYDLENNRDLWAFSNTLFPFSKTVLEAYLTNAQQNPFQAGQCRFIIDSENQTVGCIDLFEIDAVARKAGLGIALNKEQRGRGIAANALEQLLKYSKQVLHLNQVYAYIHAENTKSIKLFENAGFEISGRLKQWSHFKGELSDVMIYQKVF